MNANIWKPVNFDTIWRESDLSHYNEIAPAWERWRERVGENSQEMESFMEELKREHAIETGIIEGMYDLDRGVTETFIKEGFRQAIVQHGDANIETGHLMSILNDNKNAVDLVFDVVSTRRELTSGFIKELHALLTEHQDTTEAQDQFGTIKNVPLRKGAFKELPNNPTRLDGTICCYCPPVQVESEIENLIRIYHERESESLHPIIISAWFHHAFTTIHPFQDGNGRMARLLSSLILIKHHLFPLTIRRGDERIEYIDALEKADANEPNALVVLFAKAQRRAIEAVLNRDMYTSRTSLDDVVDAFAARLEEKKRKQKENLIQEHKAIRTRAFQVIANAVNEGKQTIEARLGSAMTLRVDTAEHDDSDKKNYWYHEQLIEYAKHHNYYYNSSLPRCWIKMSIQIKDDTDRYYQLLFDLHHYGYDDTTLALGAVLEHTIMEPDINDARVRETTKGFLKLIPLPTPPAIFAIEADFELIAQSIAQFVEKAIMQTLRAILNEL